MVRADGVVAKAGGRVVKNVAGYDLGKLMIGSFGTLAVVTEAIFRLHPVPARPRAGSRRRSTTRAARSELVQAVVHAQAVPAAVEVDWPPAGPAAVSVLLEGRGGRASPTAPRPSARLLGEAATRRHDAPAGGATYPWDLTATGDERATALKLTFVLSGLRDVLTAARDCGCRGARLGRRRRRVRRAAVRRTGRRRRARPSTGCARPAPATAAAPSSSTRRPR